MDTTQLRALNALEPFIALSKSANSPRAAADLITRATSAPNTYIFAELLSTPNIQSLRHNGGDEFAPYLTLLEIFSWGTYADYTSTTNLPSLTPAQLHKLRLLSLLPLCTATSPLTYSHLQTALSLETARSLEDLLISATYAGLLTAKLSPVTQLVHITSLSPLRDLAPGSVPHLTRTLEAWEGRCTSVLGDLEAQIANVKRRAVERRRAELERTVETERGIASVTVGIGGGGGGGGAERPGGGAAGATKRAFNGIGGDGSASVDAGDEMVGEGGMMDVDDVQGGGGSARVLRKNAKTKFGGYGRRAG
ncbi:MAG: hypothetical protein M1837_000533 [Sclerophora amabilis]|nr:MAG: hypothetical protein M1837_000533 [Sclerophora amabilis]